MHGYIKTYYGQAYFTDRTDADRERELLQEAGYTTARVMSYTPANAVAGYIVEDSPCGLIYPQPESHEITR